MSQLGSLKWFDKMMDWENGKISDEERNELFQHLIDTGIVWQLQGMYGREAARLIASGDVRWIPNAR